MAQEPHAWRYGVGELTSRYLVMLRACWLEGGHTHHFAQSSHSVVHTPRSAKRQTYVLSCTSFCSRKAGATHKILLEPKFTSMDGKCMSLLLFFEEALASKGLIYLLDWTRQMPQELAEKYLHEHFFIGLLSSRSVAHKQVEKRRTCFLYASSNFEPS